jgi:transmembrane sensor
VQDADTARVPVRRLRFGWMKIAASVVLLAGLAWLGYGLLIRKGAEVKELLVQSQQKVLNDTLPDGSVIVLNKASSLQYPERFTGDTRKVTLKGEAFFNITPNKQKPFVIDVNDVRVTVVGTSFNIKSYKGKTEVVVETGVVRVTKNGKTTELRPKEKIVTDAKDSVLQAKEEVTSQLYKYYRSKEFVCDDTPLWQLVQVLNEAYDANIVIGRKELENQRLSTIFVNESLEQVLKVIELTFNIKVIKENGKIILM